MRYRVLLGSWVDSMLRRHILFLSNASISRAERFADECAGVVQQLKSNPFLYPFDGDENLPPETYRKALLAKWYNTNLQLPPR